VVRQSTTEGLDMEECAEDPRIERTKLSGTAPLVAGVGEEIVDDERLVRRPQPERVQVEVDGAGLCSLMIEG